MATQKLNVPALRFPEFNGRWEEKPFQNIFKIGSGRDYKHLSEGDIPVYGTGGLMTRVDDFLYDGESVCIGRKGTIDNPVFLTGKFWTVDTLFYTYDFCEVSPFFLFLLFQRIDWKKHNEASGVPSLSKTTIEKITSYLPKEPEQKKIADFLTAVDQKIAQLTEKKSCLEQYKKGVMQRLFTQRFRFHDTNGNPFPDWEERRLGDLVKLQGGYAFKSDDFCREGIPVIRISNISNNDNYIDLNNLVFHSEIHNEDSFVIQRGDLLVAMSGATTGKSSIYNLDKKGYLNQRVGLFKKKSNDLVYNFLVQIVFSDFFKAKLDSVLVAGAQPNISSKDIEDFSFLFPVFKEQQKIADFLTAIDAKITALGNQLTAAQDFKKSLLQKMFV